MDTNSPLGKMTDSAIRSTTHPLETAGRVVRGTISTATRVLSQPSESPMVPAHLGGTQPMTSTPVVGEPSGLLAPVFVPGAESLTPGEIRVSVLGSGDPWIRRSQASGSLLIEVGNPEQDYFFFDLGSGSLANFTSLMLPVEATTKVFLSHLHADHIGDIPGLVGSLAKAGRVDPVEIWGGGNDVPALGLKAFIRSMGKAMAWDTASVRGVRPTTGFTMVGHEIPYDSPETIYERNGVSISSFPAIHGLNGAVGYTVEYAGLKVVFSGDTRPCKHVVEAATSADLLIHECFQSPAVFARATGLPVETALRITSLAHTIPEQMGKIFDMTAPRMGALWHLDVTPGVDAVFEEVGANYGGPVTVTQDLTVFNVTKNAVIARQAKVDDAAPPVHGRSLTSPDLDPTPAPPDWWAEALLDV
ncbi:MAG TPA: guanitoxin biosynthesis MBL fold metallo-hydrolase GntH [Dermatophilaceae bacterium]|nr:guanitoxin biosynthesis MBL fold metallo-hydrolase GntH [Dermatophilaceae bacterium]